MSHGSNRTDDAERRVLGDAQPVIATHGIGSHELNTGDELDDFELLDLVIEPPDLGLLEFECAEFLSLLITDLADALDGLRPRGQWRVAQLLKSIVRGSDGLIGRLEHAPIAVPLRSGPRLRSLPQLSEDFLNNLTNGFGIGLHGEWSRCVTVRFCYRPTGLAPVARGPLHYLASGFAFVEERPS